MRVREVQGSPVARNRMEVELTRDGLRSKFPTVARANLRQAGSERSLAARRSRSAAFPGLRRGEAA